MLSKLLDAFGTEMNVIHHTEQSYIAEIVAARIAAEIDKASSGHSELVNGAGSIYGKILKT